MESGQLLFISMEAERIPNARETTILFGARELKGGQDSPKLDRTFHISIGFSGFLSLAHNLSIMARSNHSNNHHLLHKHLKSCLLRLYFLGRDTSIRFKQHRNIIIPDCQGGLLHRNLQRYFHTRGYFLDIPFWTNC